MDVKRKAALTLSSLHDAHSELESIARQADEEDLSAPDEVAALSMLIDELLSVSAEQKQKLKEKHNRSIEMMRDFVSTQLAGCVEDKARLEELEVSKSLLEKKAERDAVELEERAEREKKLQDEVFRLGEVASRQAEALEAKNAELLPLREAKAGFDAAVQAAVQEREARIAQLNHEVKTLREASEAAGGGAAQTITDLEQQVAALQAELTEAAEAASNADALVQVDHAALTSELSAAERAADSLGKQLKAADREAGAGATARARLAAALVGLEALGSGLKQADVELSQASKAVEAARADETRAVSRAEMATQAMEQATQTLALTQAQLDSAAVESESLRAEAQTLQAKLDETSQQGVPGPAAAPTEPAAASAEATQRLEAAAVEITELKAALSTERASFEEQMAALHAQQLQQVRKMEADLEAALASAEAAGSLGETVVRVQLRLGELLEQQPQPGYLAALLEALREVDARFADAIEASLLETKAQQLAVLRETLRDPLSAVDEALLRAWEQLWDMALASGQERAALQEQMRRDAEQRRRDEATAAEAVAATAAAAAAAAAGEEAAAAAAREADARPEAGGGVAEGMVAQLEAQLKKEKKSVGDLRSQLLRLAARASAEKEELLDKLRVAKEDLEAAPKPDGNVAEQQLAQRFLVGSLREEVARQRANRLGSMDAEARSAEEAAAALEMEARRSEALQLQVDALAAQLEQRALEAEEAREAHLASWQAERDALLAQSEREAASLASRLNSQHAEAAVGFKFRLGQLKKSLRDASGNGAAFDALQSEHSEQTAAAEQRHAFELGELRAEAEAERARLEAASAQRHAAELEAEQSRNSAAIGRLGRTIAHASRTVLTHARNALADAAPTEAAAAAAEASAVGAATGDDEAEAMATAYGTVAALQASCIESISAAAQIAQEMARKALLARAQAAELCGVEAKVPASRAAGLPLPQLATEHGAQLDALLEMLRLAPRPSQPPSPRASSVPPSRVPASSSPPASPPHRGLRPSSRASSPGPPLARPTDRAPSPVDPDSMAGRHQEALERGEARREQLRAARTANIERGMMAVTTIVYNGSMSGGAVSI